MGGVGEELNPTPPLEFFLRMRFAVAHERPNAESEDSFQRLHRRREAQVAMWVQVNHTPLPRSVPGEKELA